jgi:hypothetical protein
MIPSTPNRSLPGTLFLTFARLIFPAQTVASVFSPAVADLREELREAGSSRMKQLAIRCRWYWALCSLLMVAPLWVRTSPVSGSSDAVVAVPNGGWLLMLLMATLYVGTWSFFGSFVSSTVSAGVALAYVMRTWHDKHPTAVVEPWRLAALPAVQINLSAIRVAGDGPGLIFAVGTVLIVVVGLPGLWWFFVAAALGSLLVAWSLFTRRSTEPSGLLNSIRCQ